MMDLDGNEAVCLPPHDGLDIPRFSLVFRDTNTSHKFLWALAFLRFLSGPKAPVHELPLRKLAAGMLDSARRPFHVFRLRSGKDDRIHDWFLQLERSPTWSRANLARPHGRVFSTRPEDIPDTVFKGLTSYVSSLFLAPFFTEQIRGLAGPPRFRRIRMLARERFNDGSPPPYRFSEAGETIVFHPKWAEYMTRNARILKSWVLWHWARYMQRMNPSVPAIVSKLDEDVAPNTRRQRDFWTRVMEAQAESCFCIYTRKVMTPGRFALDHYVPWSFVAHDEMWNLVPVSIQGNERKSDNLPDNSVYFDGFVDMQHRAIDALHHFHDKSRWDTLFESYSVHLNLDVMERPPDRAALREALANAVDPLLSLAASRRFSPNWTFPKTR